MKRPSWLRWPWRRTPHYKARIEEADRLTRRQAAEAEKRVEKSQRLAARFREIRDQNHFAESIRNALGEGR